MQLFKAVEAYTEQAKMDMALYCNISVEGIVISLIINKVSIKIEKPSTINIINIHRQSQRAIRKIFNFSFLIEEIRVSVNMFITDATSYKAIMKNNWLSKVNTKINYTYSEISFVCHPTKTTRSKEELDYDNKETESKYKEEELEN
ncbi:6226_t:CDS:2 [Cetraspora pellucida]|uniref:6226_t:CDS:1 n=1 Tax=Cetraspora pellucida TaxID=1433469 RepID=A0A9N9E2V3_9GLOM|nr:6226_t:CDS:2 [Cetraspora pellucida]